MSTVRSLQARIADSRATTAIEFAILAPAFLALMVGLLYLAVGMYTVASLHYAAEDAARCASVKTTVCNGSGAIQAEAQSHYYGPALSPAFTYAAAACGNKVTGSLTYVLNMGVKQFSIPLSASACFP